MTRASQERIRASLNNGAPSIDNPGAYFTFEQLLYQCKTTAGIGYAEARYQFTAESLPAAGELLRRKIKTSSDEHECWLAEILLARVEHSAELRKFEAALQRAVVNTAGSYAAFWHRPRPPRPGGYAIMLADDPVPDLATIPVDGRIMLGNKTPRLPPSDKWRSLLGEILLRGWQPEEPSLPTADRTEQRAYRRIVEDDYVDVAMHCWARWASAGPIRGRWRSCRSPTSAPSAVIRRWTSWDRPVTSRHWTRCWHGRNAASHV